MKKFRYWIVWFLIALCVIPICLTNGFIVVAKIIGVATVVTLVIALRIWLYRTKKEFNPIEQVKINTNDRFELKRAFTLYNSLTENERSIFESRLGLFLAKTQIYTSNDLSRVDYILVAAFAIAATWHEAQEDFSLNPSSISVEKQASGEYMISRLSEVLVPETAISLTIPCDIPMLDLAVNKNFWKN